MIKEWNELQQDILNFDSFVIFKSKLLKFIQPCPNIVFNGHNPKENEGNHTSPSWFESTLLTKI